MDILQSILDSSSHAIFTLNSRGIVTHINRQAKEQFGLVNHSEFSHGAGRLNRGDFVILGDTAIGEDDGNLRPEELKWIGVNDKKIRPGDIVLAAGLYDVEGSHAVYKHVHAGNTQRLNIQTQYEGIPISADIENDEVAVTVGNMRYSIGYFMSICQLVVLDKHTRRVKFWQEKGYSARKEGIGQLLRGNDFAAKSPDMEIDVVGYHFSEFFEGRTFEENLQKVLSGEADRFVDQVCDINGYALVASILPVSEEDRREGVIVRFRKIEDMKVTITERNNAIIKAEEKYRKAEQVGGGRVLGENAFSGLFGNSTAMASVKRYAYKLSQLDCSILITGESGTGKSFMAQAIGREQPRKGPFITVDCSTIAPTLFESEMFGYVGGAFTGANPKGKKGFFEEADGGTIFLDEIGEVPISIQAKLLNVIQNKTLTRVGSTLPVPVDVRIIAATNRDLKREAAEGRFRQDLYYRLSAFALELPPLRECREDIYFLINNLMENIREKYGMSEKYLSGEAFSKLISYSWPGNVRELENILERAVALSDSDIIYAEHIELETESRPMTLREQLKAEEKRIIQQALIQNKGSRMHAMAQLGLTKTVFYSKLKEHGIE